VVRAAGHSLAAIALTTNTSILTAVSNDFGFEECFARQVQALGVAGDIVIAISTSGRSASILKAVEAARALGCYTAAFTGRTGAIWQRNWIAYLPCLPRKLRGFRKPTASSVICIAIWSNASFFQGEAKG